jgi:uncharacterized membrane protein
MKTTILGGVLFLVPLVCVVFVLKKAFDLSKLIATPLQEKLGLQSFGGIGVADILAVFFILVVCFIAGHVAKQAVISKRVGKLDAFLMSIIPGYAVVKGVVGGLAQQDDAVSILNPVLVQFDDYEQLAFEIEKAGDRSVVYLPGSPSLRSGSCVIVKTSRVIPLDLPPHRLISLMRHMGRGIAKQDIPFDIKN